MKKQIRRERKELKKIKNQELVVVGAEQSSKLGEEAARELLRGSLVI